VANKHTHTNNRALIMQPHPLTTQTMPTLPHHLSQFPIKRIRKHDVSHQPALKVRERPDPLRTINDLIRNHKVAWLDLLLQTADGGKGNDGAHAETAEGGNVGAGGHFVGRVFVVQAVAGEEGDGDGLACAGGGVVQD